MYPGESVVGEAVAAPQLVRHHPLVVYTLGTLTPIHKARSPVEVGPETQLQHMCMDLSALPVVHPLL
nr:hypothetical protein [Tanacetum cinerariifolium]